MYRTVYSMNLSILFFDNLLHNEMKTFHSSDNNQSNLISAKMLCWRQRQPRKVSRGRPERINLNEITIKNTTNKNVHPRPYTEYDYN